MKRRISAKQSSLTHFFSKKSALQNVTCACSGLGGKDVTDADEQTVCDLFVPNSASSKSSQHNDDSGAQSEVMPDHVPDIMLKPTTITDEQECEIENTGDEQLAV